MIPPWEVDRLRVLEDFEWDQRVPKRFPPPPALGNFLNVQNGGFFTPLLAYFCLWKYP